MANQRRCGGCTACCEAMQVEEIGKPERTRCKFQKTNVGCAAYDERPTSCRDFLCLWMTGMGSNKERPDRVGVVLVSSTSERFGPMLQVHELYAGAADQQFARGAISRAHANKIRVVVFRKDGMRTMLDPSSLVR